LSKEQHHIDSYVKKGIKEIEVSFNNAHWESMQKILETSGITLKNSTANPPSEFAISVSTIVFIAFIAISLAACLVYLFLATPISQEEYPRSINTKEQLQNKTLIPADTNTSFPSEKKSIPFDELQKKRNSVQINKNVLDSVSESTNPITKKTKKQSDSTDDESLDIIW